MASPRRPRICEARTGTELIRARVATCAARRLALVGATAAGARNVMVEGESGILAIFPPWDRPRYEPSKRRLTRPNGAIATLYSADEPERRAGRNMTPRDATSSAAGAIPSVGHADVRAAIRHRPTGRGHRDAAADQIGPSAARRSDGRGDGWLDLWNRANLAPAFLDQIIRKYEGTRLGRQELEAELLDDVPGDSGPAISSKRRERIMRPR